jgi:rRNA maturation endonuclease Nob1
MPEINFCPSCGEKKLADEGNVFIEDGPYDGRQFLNEGEWWRYRCESCGLVFGPMPTPMTCAKCGNHLCGELGEDCDEYEGHQDEYLCEDCMTKEKK